MQAHTGCNPGVSQCLAAMRGPPAAPPRHACMVADPSAHARVHVLVVLVLKVFLGAGLAGAAWEAVGRAAAGGRMGALDPIPCG